MTPDPSADRWKTTGLIAAAEKLSAEPVPAVAPKPVPAVGPKPIPPLGPKPVASITAADSLSIEKQMFRIIQPRPLLALIIKNFGRQAAIDVGKKFRPQLNSAIRNNFLPAKDILNIRNFLKKYPLLTKRALAPISPAGKAPAPVEKKRAVPVSFSSIERQLLREVASGQISGFIEKHFGKQVAAEVRKNFGIRISNAMRSNYLPSKDVLNIRDFLRKYPVLSQRVPAAGPKPRHPQQG